ncbi:MAG: DUF1848 domain-containing protein [Spirochaetaceae bacterium]|nr:DUF1848 domain-containing protein [Spirochaetaceae bacterium]
MILNTGARTDTVHYFSQWLLKRFQEGYVLSRNPLYPDKVTRYELTPEKIDAVLFCSKNYKPILPHIKTISDKFNTYFHYTITAYGKDIEPGVPSIQESIETLKRLSCIVGKEKISWRYDPILLTKKYTIETHKLTFDMMAKEIAPYVNNCIFSFVKIYKKIELALPELIPFSEEAMEIIAKDLGKIAQNYNLPIQTCGTNKDFTQYGIAQSGCTTLGILEKANGISFKKLKHNGFRNGCHCIESRDIGFYNTCLSGCKYCYANKNHQLAKENYALHNPDSPLLLGNLKETDILQQGIQRSFLQKTSQKDIQEFDF